MRSSTTTESKDALAAGVLGGCCVEGGVQLTAVAVIKAVLGSILSARALDFPRHELTVARRYAGASWAMGYASSGNPSGKSLIREATRALEKWTWK